MVAGVAATGVLVAAPDANADVTPTARATVRLSFQSKLLASADAKKTLLAALDELFDKVGCPTCGLVGFDIHLEELILPYKSEISRQIQISLEGGEWGR
jgi:hypothetical protein